MFEKLKKEAGVMINGYISSHSSLNKGYDTFKRELIDLDCWGKSDIFWNGFKK